MDQSRRFSWSSQEDIYCVIDDRLSWQICEKLVDHYVAARQVLSSMECRLFPLVDFSSSRVHIAPSRNAEERRQEEAFFYCGDATLIDQVCVRRGKIGGARREYQVDVKRRSCCDTRAENVDFIKRLVSLFESFVISDEPVRCQNGLPPKQLQSKLELVIFPLSAVSSYMPIVIAGLIKFSHRAKLPDFSHN